MARRRRLASFTEAKTLARKDVGKPTRNAEDELDKHRARQYPRSTGSALHHAVCRSEIRFTVGTCRQSPLHTLDVTQTLREMLQRPAALSVNL